MSSWNASELMASCVNVVRPAGVGQGRPLWLRRAALLLCLLLVAGCQNGMEEQPKYEPYEASVFFENGMSSRPMIDTTVARGQLRADAHLYAGQSGDAAAVEFPFPITSEVVVRGQERYGIYCAPCHGVAGYGDGMIVQRGFSPPPSFHEQRLREVPVGYLFQVITNGVGAMYSYADRVPPEDRWAIVAYMRALQLSQNATMDVVPAEMQPALEASTEEATEGIPFERADGTTGTGMNVDSPGQMENTTEEATDSENATELEPVTGPEQ